MSAVRIFDINLRQTYYSQDTIEASLALCNVLKVSDEELPIISPMLELDGTVEHQLRQLVERYALRLVAYTRGARGAILLSTEEQSDHPGFETDVVDTVGAGDSFTAALCMGMLLNFPLERINTHANRIGSYVCGQSGATPQLPHDLRESFVNVGI